MSDSLKKFAEDVAALKPWLKYHGTKQWFYCLEESMVKRAKALTKKKVKP